MILLERLLAYSGIAFIIAAGATGNGWFALFGISLFVAAFVTVVKDED